MVELKRSSKQLVRDAMRRSDSLWLAGRPRLMLEWYRRWGKKPVVSWMRAAEYFIAGDFSRAAELYQTGLKRSPNHPAAACARMDLGYCLYRGGEYSRAVSELEILVKEKTPIRDAFLLLARIHHFTSDANAAMSALDAALEKFPNDITVLTSLLHTGLWNKCATRSIATAYQRLSDLRRELLLDDSRRVLLDTALAHYQLYLGNESSGERLLVRALATGLAPFEAVLLRGERLLQQHRIYPAREQLSRAVQLSPRNPNPLRLLAESYLLPGDFLEPQYAVQLLTTAAQLSKWQNRSVLELLAKAQRQVGEVAIAELYEAKAAKLPEAASSDDVVAAFQRDGRLRALKINA